MTYVVFFAILLLITLLGTYLVIENNRRNAREAEKKLFNNRVAEVTNNLKGKLNYFCEAHILRPKYIPRLQVIASNFFVVQPHSDENLLYLERIVESFISTVNSELTKSFITGDRDKLADQLSLFVAELPYAGIEYNRAFYYEILPSLIKTLESPDISNEPDIIEISDKQEPDDSQSHSFTQQLNVG